MTTAPVISGSLSRWQAYAGDKDVLPTSTRAAALNDVVQPGEPRLVVGDDVARDHIGNDSWLNHCRSFFRLPDSKAHGFGLLQCALPLSSGACGFGNLQLVNSVAAP